MIGLLQRVRHAQIEVGGERIARVERGILVLVGVQADDGPADAERLARRLVAYRVFEDAAGRMNLSVSDVDGGILLVPQFTLAADTRRGSRASFGSAAAPERAAPLFETLAAAVRCHHPSVASGQFGADMQVALVNDGPVTFWLATRASG